MADPKFRLARDISRWRRCDPEAMAYHQIQAQKFAFIDAKHDILALHDLCTDLLAALRRADGFITNGIALGFIRMPDAETPDSAHEVPPLVREAISKASGVAQ